MMEFGVELQNLVDMLRFADLVNVDIDGIALPASQEFDVVLRYAISCR